MKLIHTNKLLKTLLADYSPSYLVRFTTKNKNFIELCMMWENDAIQINLRPKSDFGKINSIAIHTNELELLDDSISTALKDNFPAIELYILDNNYLAKTSTRKQVA